MKSNELRRGNLITLSYMKGKMCTVTHILEDIVRFDIDSEHNSHTIYEYIEPVPLTEKRLLKYGFTEVTPRSGIAKSFKKNGVRINMSNTGNFYYNKLLIPSVHKLQNLYYVLKEEEI